MTEYEGIRKEIVRSPAVTAVQARYHKPVWNWVFFGEPNSTSTVKKFHTFLLKLYSQHATGPLPEPDESSPHLLTYDQLNSTFQSISLTWLSHFRVFWRKFCTNLPFLRPCCTAHRPHLLNLTTTSTPACQEPQLQICIYRQNNR
jgi:hypothetical protein